MCNQREHHCMSPNTKFDTCGLADQPLKCMAGSGDTVCCGKGCHGRGAKDSSGLQGARPVVRNVKKIQLDLNSPAVLSVREMSDLPDHVIQLAVEAHFLETGEQFTDAVELFLAAEKIAKSPEKQAFLARKLHLAEIEAEKKQLADSVEEDGASVNTDKAAVKADEAAVKAGEAVVKTDEAVVKADEAVVKADEAVVKTDEAAVKADEAVVKADIVVKIDEAAEENRGKGHATTDAIPNFKNNVDDEDNGTGKTTTDVKVALLERIRRLTAENKKLERRKKCRVCRKVDLAVSGVTFLPCGHYLVCETCAEACDECPACGKSIMGTVRTFLA